MTQDNTREALEEMMLCWVPAEHHARVRAAIAALSSQPPAPQVLPPLTDDMLRYAMAVMGTGSPADAANFRLFWRFAAEAFASAPSIIAKATAPTKAEGASK